MRILKTIVLILVLLVPTYTFAFRVFPTTAQDERMFDKNNFPFIAANADGFNLQYDSFGPFSESQVSQIFDQFTNKNLINHGVYNGNNIYTMSTMTKLPNTANVTAFMLYTEAPAMDKADWESALAQNVTWPLITHCRAYSTASTSNAVREQILMTQGIMMEFQVTDEGKYDDAAALMKFCVDNNRMVTFLTTFQQTPDVFIAAYKKFYYYLKKNLGPSYLDSDNVIFIPNTYSDDQVFPETLGYGSTFGVAHWLIDQKTKTGDGYLQPTVSITSPGADSYFEDHKDLIVNASATNGTITKMDLYINGELVGEDTEAPFSWRGGILDDLRTGYKELRVDATDDQGVVTSEAIRIKILKPAPSVPGFFQADNLLRYDLRNIPHEDGYIRHVYGKEWIDYKLNVEHAGTYDVEVSLKVQRSKQYGGTISIKKGTTTLGSYTTVLNDPANSPLPNFTEYPEAVVKNVRLTAGEQVLRMYFSRPGGAVKPQFYLYDFNFKLQGAPSITFTTPTVNDAGRYPEYSAPAEIDIKANVISPRNDGTVKKASLYIDDVLVSELNAEPYQWLGADHNALSAVAAGEHVLKVVAEDDKGYRSFEEITLSVIEREPYRTMSLPGITRAIEFDLGGEGVAYHDFNEGVERGLGGAQNPRYAKAGNEDVEIELSGGTHVVSAVRNGEWLNYTFASVEAGTYEVRLMTSANKDKSADVNIWLNNKLLTVVPIKETAASGFTTYRNHTVKGVVIPKDMTNATLKLEFINPNISNYLCFYRQFQFIRTGDVPAGIHHSSKIEDAIFDIHPNPAKDQVTIDLKDMAQASLVIYDLKGQVVDQLVGLTGKYQYSTSQLSAGTYILKLSAQDKQAVKRLIIL